MKLDWHNNDESFLINGKSINQIIAMLEILEKKNPDVKSLRDFIRYLKHIPSFDSILNTFQVVTRAEDLSLRERNEDGLTLNEILDRLDMGLSGDI